MTDQNLVNFDQRMDDFKLCRTCYTKERNWSHAQTDR